ncbi:MAG TPA: class I SAM-dependent methyltransferase [Blastocatellia bacterium]|nr:class I SAM-dependent methyltransferase [Blastocatellia bacterium]
MQSTEIQKQLAIDQHSIQAKEFAERYREMSEDSYRSCFTYSRKRLDALLAPEVPSQGDGLRLLDVGCGTGHHMASLRERGFDVAGVDGSPEMLDQARANNPGAEIKLSDVESLPFPDASFDFILCIEVLRYLPSAVQCVREMSRVLKPGGVCVATATPLMNLNGYWVVNRLANLVRVGDLVRLKQFFTTSWQLKREFSEAGFSDTSVSGVYLGPVNWIERLTPRLLPAVLKTWEPLDSILADSPVLRELSNMYMVRAIRGGQQRTQ